MDRNKLAARLAPISEAVADFVLREQTSIEMMPAPFLRDGAILYILYRGPHHPIAWTVGLVGDDFTVFLAKDPEHFEALALRAGVDLSTPANRLAYVRTYLEATRDLQARFEILEKFDDIPLIDKPTAAERSRYDILRRAYESQIRPPAAVPDHPWTFTLYLLRPPFRLVRMTATLSENGRLRMEETTLEQDLPIASVH